MKIRLLIVLIVCFIVGAKAQDGPDFTQLHVAAARDNPGLTGIDPFFNINLGYKQAWKGFSNNASISYLSVFGQIGKRKDLEAGKYSFRISNPKMYQKLKQSKKARRNHGIGLSVNSVELGFFKNIESKAYYAYHIPVSDLFNLSLGTAVGVSQRNIDYSGLQVRDEVNDVFYQGLLNQANGRSSYFMVDFGLGFYTDDFFISLTGNSLVEEMIGGDEIAITTSNERMYSVLTGYKFPIGTQFTLYPNAGVKFNEFYDYTLQGSLRIRYEELIYAGGGIQDDYRLSALFGLKVINNIFLHYSYDHYMGEVNRFAEGTHEVTLGMTLFNKYNTSPFLW